MNGDNKKDDIDADIERIFRTGNRKDDPAAKLTSDRVRALFQAGRISPSNVRDILADDAKVSALIEKTRHNLAEIEAHPRAAPAPPHSIDKDLAEAILTGQAEMRAEIAEMRAVTLELKAATDKTVAATAEIKTASEIMHTDLKKAVRALTLGAAFRTAVFLTPFSLVSSVVGNEATPAVDHILSRVFGWKAAPTMPSAPSSPPTVNLDNRQYRIVLPAIPLLSDKPFVIRKRQLCIISHTTRMPAKANSGPHIEKSFVTGLPRVKARTKK